MSEKTSKQKVGGMGENEAVQYLINKGYKIIERNHRQKWGEIDVVAADPDGILVFVEVKALISAGAQEMAPEDNLTNAKLRKLQRICQLYAGSHEKLVGDKGWRIDLVAVDVSGSNCSLRHYENI